MLFVHVSLISCCFFVACRLPSFPLNNHTQSAYGVADTSLFWSQATGKGWNFVWSIGQTPFSSLSNIHTLSFAQRDAAIRNLAVSYLNNSIAHAAHLIKGFAWLAPYDSGTHHVKAFLQPDQVCVVVGVCAVASEGVRS